MPLGIEHNSIAPALVAGSGQALVQGIRQIGQQISGHLTELQTKRDLGALAQEMQGINVQSNEFPVQLTQMLSRHPLAARDERGQIALSILGKAHGQWQAGEAEARAFNRSMAMQTRRTQDARETAAINREAELGMPRNVPGVGLVDPDQIDPVTGQAKVLAAAPARGSTALPFGTSSAGIYDRRTGEITTPAPAKKGPEMTQRRMVIEGQLRELDRDLNIGLKEHQRILKEEEDLKKELGDDPKEEKKKDLEYRRSVKALDAEKALRKINETRSKKLKLAEDLGALGLGIEEAELPPVTVNAAAPMPLTAAAPTGEVLPAPGAIAAPPASVEMVAVIDPNGRPGKVKASQLEAALQNGYKRR